MWHFFTAIWVCLSLVFSTAVFMAGCGKLGFGKKSADKIVARVNKEPITQTELARELAMRMKQDPSFKLNPETEAEQLTVMINRKIIVQEAMQKGLARQEKFVSTIKSFWEQALIRDFLEVKRQEFGKLISATEDDINKYYNRMRFKATFKVVRTRDKDTLDMADKAYKLTKDTSTWVTVGPVSYDEVAQSVLGDGFDLEQGEIRMTEDPPYYYIIRLSEKIPQEVPPLETIKAEVEKRAIAVKERKLFENWLNNKRARTKISVSRDGLK